MKHLAAASFMCLTGSASAETTGMNDFLALGPAMLGPEEAILEVIDQLDPSWVVLESEGPTHLPVSEGDIDALILTMQYRASPRHRGLAICVRFGVATQIAILDDPDGPLAARMLAPLSSDLADFGRYEMIMDCSFTYQADAPLQPQAVWKVMSTLPGQAEIQIDPSEYGRHMLSAAPWTFVFDGDLPAGLEPVLKRSIFMATERQQLLSLRFVSRTPFLS